MKLHDVKPVMPFGLYPEEWDDRINCIELAPVVNLAPDSSDTTECERDDFNANPDFYSLYAHIDYVGCLILGDFQTYADAVTAAEILSAEKGVPWDNYAFRLE